MRQLLPNEWISLLQSDHVGLALQMERLEKFIARRFDELSTEVFATGELVDRTEQSIKTSVEQSISEAVEHKIASILESLSAISTLEGGMTPVNQGLELEAVVTSTEQAANKIMDLTEKMMARLDDEEDWNDPMGREEKIADMREDLEQILLNCSFQDLAGQRIRTAVKNIKEVQQMMTEIIDELGIEVNANEGLNAKLEDAKKIFSQSDIDALFD